ncbi:7928_t:CDS:1, partial [Funneliformis geosporum]
MTTNYIIEKEFSWDKKPIVKFGTIENIEDTPDRVSKALASLGKECMDFIDNKENALFKKSYRIEIVPAEHPQWEFQLYFPAETWFDRLYYVKAESAEEKNKVLATAREYVNSVRSTYRPSIPETSLTPVLSKIYCATHANCIISKYPRTSLLYLLDKITNIITCSDNKIGGRHDPRYSEPNIFCRKSDVPQRSKTPTKCNWYAENERIVSRKSSTYVILSRQEH